MGTAPESLGSETLTFLHDEVRSALIIEMPAEELIAAAEQMEVNDLADMIEKLPEPVRQTIEDNLSDEVIEYLETSLSFDEDTADRLRLVLFCGLVSFCLSVDIATRGYSLIRFALWLNTIAKTDPRDI